MRAVGYAQGSTIFAEPPLLAHASTERTHSGQNAHPPVHTPSAPQVQSPMHSSNVSRSTAEDARSSLLWCRHPRLCQGESRPRRHERNHEADTRKGLTATESAPRQGRCRPNTPERSQVHRKDGRREIHHNEVVGDRMGTPRPTTLKPTRPEKILANTNGQAPTNDGCVV